MINKVSRGVLGIMVGESNEPVPFAEPGFCRKLCLIGSKQGMTVYVFCPSYLRRGKDTVPGYCYENGGWHQRLFPPPDIIYDRCFTHDRSRQQRKKQALAHLSETHPFLYLTRGLTGKWRVYQVLRKFPKIALHLPESVPYESPTQLADWLESHQGEVFLKPQNGTHGKRTLHVRAPRAGDGLRIAGRDSRNGILRHRFTTRNEGLEWIDKFTANRPFLMQPYLELSTSEGEPFDVRVLMQKNETGSWQLTGMAVRVGPKHALTSNLHGGGSAHKAVPFLSRELGTAAAREALSMITKLSMEIPGSLESHFGRLAELGIDYGIDRRGKVWVLEVNSKPGRSSFFRIGDYRSARKSMENPILYARYLLLSKP
ncbi:YheC/D-like protein [Fontibacillus phaseoli]|uniref:YheC/D-like protein n=1 Tax=Fontibacillus phaseoli TaxID=1416533 RepID=A0A369B7A8_9BACL|nr:YheC/YheD family protein [Fontibacillus phaseoli]RCX17311.1 YheC/D-like protein [Fontibacillus phaseoli]